MTTIYSKYTFHVCGYIMNR